jgi:hypothetical protein
VLLPPAKTPETPRPGDTVIITVPDKPELSGTDIPKPASPELPAIKHRKPLHRQIWDPLKATTRVILLLWVSAFGAGTLYDAVVGDGPEPAMHAVPVKSPQDLRRNTTMPIFHALTRDTKTIDPEVAWESLGPTRELLQRFSPEVHDWFVKMHAAKLIRYSPSNTNTAFFDVGTRQLNLHDSFFMESDRHKVAILTHEYWHSRQNPGKHLARLVSPRTIFGPMVETGYHAMTGKLLCEPGFTAYGSQVEDEAYCLESRASRLLGIDTAGPADYFRQRGQQCAHNH